MAGDWIKMRNNLWDDPRISNICDIIRAGEACVVGGLYWLWSAADEHTESGFMPGLSSGSIDRKTGVAGLGDALVHIGWITEDKEGITINRFDEHNGTSAKRRSTDAQRKANTRSLSASDADRVGTLSGQNSPNRGAREEKRRIELNASIPGGIDVASVADDQRPAKVSNATCPHQEIIELYHEVLPQCPPIRDWTRARMAQLRARWNEDDQRQDLGYWRRFFEYVGECDFLVGRSGKAPFFADLEWITKSSNFVKIRERKYENRSTS